MRSGQSTIIAAPSVWLALVLTWLVVVCPSLVGAQSSGPQTPSTSSPETIVNIAQVTVPSGVIDPDINNNTDSAFLSRAARLLIEKLSQGGDGQFDFSLSGAQTSSQQLTTVDGQASSGYQVVAAGTYNLTEAEQATFGLVSLSCSDQDGDTQVSGSRDTGFSATLVIAEGEDVACQFENHAYAQLRLRLELDQGAGVFSYPHTLESPTQLPNPVEISPTGGLGEALLEPLWSGDFQIETLQKQGFELISSKCSGLDPAKLSLPQDSDGNGVLDGDVLGLAIAPGEQGDCLLRYRSAAPDVRLFKQATSGPNYVGNDSYALTYRLEVVNSGSAQLSLTSLTDDLTDLLSQTAGVTFVGEPRLIAPPAGFTGSLNPDFDGATGLKGTSSELIATPGNLAPEETLQVEFDVLVTRKLGATYLDNIAEVNADGAGQSVSDLSSDPANQEPISIESARLRLAFLSWLGARPAQAQSGGNANNVTRIYFAPYGTVYDARSGAPLAGASLRMLNSSGSPIDGSVFYSGQQGQTTAANGAYYFDINVDSPLAPADGLYYLSITPPSGYLAPSSLRPALPGALSLPAGEGEVLVSNQTPAAFAQQGAAIPAYYLAFDIGSSRRRVTGNHLPLDPVDGSVVNLLKSADEQDIQAGDILGWRLHANNLTNAQISNARLLDTLPPGLSYVDGSARMMVGGVTSEPQVTVSGQSLSFTALSMTAQDSLVITFLTRSSAALKPGTLTNQAQLFDQGGAALSNLASDSVTVATAPVFGCSDVLGRSFEDTNANGYHDLGEEGLPGVVIYTAKGLKITSDRYGRFHVPCAQIPDDERGQNMILKVDANTLPQGCQITTENPRVIRLTAGKLTKVSFGAVCPKTIRVTLCEPVFVPGQTQIQGQWGAHLQTLVDLVQKSPSQVLLSHPTQAEPELAQARLRRLSDYLRGKAQTAGFEASISTETSPDLSACPSGNYGPAVTLPPASQPAQALPPIRTCTQGSAAPGLSFCAALKQLKVEDYSQYQARGVRVADYNAYVGHVEEWKRDYQESQAQKEAWSDADIRQVQQELSQRFYQLLDYRKRYIAL